MKGGEKMNEKKKKVRDRKFLSAYIQNSGNATKAYLAVNPEYKGNSARELGRKMLTKVDISDDEIMKELGITDKYLFEKLKEGTEAMKRTRQGQKVEDYAVRHQYIDTILKLKNKYPPGKTETEMIVEEKSEEEEFYKQVNNLLEQLTVEELREIVYSDKKKTDNKSKIDKKGGVK